MKRIILVLLIGFIFSCNQKAKSDKGKTSQNSSISDSLTSQLMGIYKDNHINGFSVAIVNQNGTLYEKGIGFSDIQSKTLYTENTIQNIGSVSKTLIAISLLKAQELGKLNLDDPINKYLPFKVQNPSHPKEQITIRHLATHTSSILDTEFYDQKSYVLKDTLLEPNLSLEKENFNTPSTKIPMLDFLKKVLSKDGDWYKAKEGFSKNKPGEIYEYSNVGATLAAAIVEIAVKKPYNEFTTEYILEPLKMNSSGWSFETIDLAKHSKLYSDVNTELPYYSLITYPDGGLLTNMTDFGKYLTELIKGYMGKGTILQKNSYKQLFQEQLTGNNLPERDKEEGYDSEYNVGIFMGFTREGMIGHSGGDPGIASYMFFNPKTKIGRILMINTSVMNSDGVDEFYKIWNTAGEYEDKLTKNIKVP
jgi:CubicO group peptidase (beta-lactamase class C family)